MAPADEKLDTVLAALAQLTTVVGSLAESVAHLADHPGGDPAPASDVPEQPVCTLIEDDGYAPLVPQSDDNGLARLKLVQRLGIFGTPAGEALLAGGARGFYRMLEREDGQLGHNIPRDIATSLVLDAEAEDPREAVEMSHDLLKVWTPRDAPAPGVDKPDVEL